MPRPIRPSPTHVPTPPVRPSGPAPAGTPTTLNTPSRPGDGFGPTVSAPVAPGQLPGPVALGKFDDLELSIGKDGRLTIAGDTGTLSDALKVNRLALKAAGERNPFAEVQDKAALAAAATRLSMLHHSGLAAPAGDKEVLDFRQLRAGSLALLEQAAVRAGELGAPELQKQLSDQLTAAIRLEPYRALRDFCFDSVVARSADGKLPKAATAEEAIYPARPPTQKWLEDGVLRVAYYIDNEGSELDYQLSFMRSLGLKERKIDDCNYVFSREARAGQPKIEVLFRSPKTHDDKPQLLEKIDDAAVDIIAYTGHAGYGHRVDHAIAHGAQSTGEGKLVVLMQCSGEGNVESLERAFPDAQVLSTTEPSTDNHDQLMFKKVLNGVLAGKDWSTMQTEVTEGMKRMSFLGDASPEKHFFYPNTRAVLAPKYDRDRDGVRDVGDRVFNVIYPKRLDAAGGFDPVVQAIADDALDGTALSKATSALGLTMRYNNLLSPDAAAKVKWSAEAPEPAGFFSPKDGDLRAFQFSLDPAAGKLKVALSTRFAHSSDKDLSRMLSYEAGLFLGKEAGLDGKGQVALGLGMLERVVHQQDGWYYGSSVLEEPWAEETLLLRRYGLEGVGFADVSEALGHSDDLKPEHLAALTRMVEARPGLGDAGSRAPTCVGEPIPVPAGLRLGASGLDASALARVLTAMGVEGTVSSFGPTWLSAGEPNNLAVMVRDPSGKTQQIGLSLDNEGYLRTASRLDLGVDKVKDRSGRQYLAEVAKVAGLDAGGLVKAYGEELSRGSTAAEAVATVLSAQRGRVPLGIELPRLEIFDKLRSYGLATPEEHAAIKETLARCYPTGEALSAEKAVLGWLDAVGGADKERLRGLYREALASDGTRLGAGRSLVAVFEALPRPLPSTPAFPLTDALKSGLVAPGAQALVARAYLDRSGMSGAAFAAAMAAAWAPSWMSDEVKTNLERDVGALVARNAPVREVLTKHAEVLSAGSYQVPDYQLALFEEMNLLAPADAQALASRIEELRRARSPS